MTPRLTPRSRPSMESHDAHADPTRDVAAAGRSPTGNPTHPTPPHPTLVPPSIRGASGVGRPESLPPDLPEVREHWQLGLVEYLARKERTRNLRAELAAARAAGKARRHADRLGRIRAATRDALDTTTTEAGSP